VGTEGSFPGGKAAEREAGHWPHPVPMLMRGANFHPHILLQGVGSFTLLRKNNRIMSILEVQALSIWLTLHSTTTVLVTWDKMLIHVLSLLSLIYIERYVYGTTISMCLCPPITFETLSGFHETLYEYHPIRSCFTFLLFIVLSSVIPTWRQCKFLRW
jgi:hypothetical protein